MATQLSLYNDALLLCGERFLATLTDAREPRRLLDQVWNNGLGAINFCLEQGQWEFAMRTIQIDYDLSIQPTFGYQRAFTKPADWILTSAFAADEYFRVPLTRYVDETGYWYAEIDTVYIRYVSNHALYGGNLASWPASFADYTAAWMASRIIAKLSNSEATEKKILELVKERLKIAKSRCAMANPTEFSAQGNWSKARQRWNNRRDGGNGNTSGSLIG